MTSLSDAGRIGLDFGEIEDGARYASVSSESVRLEHAWARTVRSARDAASSVHFLAGATNNRQTTYMGMTRHRDRCHVYVPDRDPAGFVGRLLSTSGRQRFALDFAPDLAPDGPRVLADYLEADGGGREGWLERIHRTGKGQRHGSRDGRGWHGHDGFRGGELARPPFAHVGYRIGILGPEGAAGITFSGTGRHPLSARCSVISPVRCSMPSAMR